MSEMINLKGAERPEFFPDLQKGISVELPGGDLITVGDGEVVFSDIPGVYVGIAEWKVYAFIEVWMEARRDEQVGGK